MLHDIQPYLEASIDLEKKRAFARSWPEFRLDALAARLKNAGAEMQSLNRALLLLMTSIIFFSAAEMGVAATPTFTFGNGVFPTAPVGQSTTQSVTLTVNTAVPITSIAISPDFTEYKMGTVSGCTIDSTGNTIVAAGSVCSIAVTFTPVAPGKATSATPIGRSAPLVVDDIESGKATGYSFALEGTGTGPLASFYPGVAGYIGDATTVCAQAIDSAGDGCPASEANVYASSMAMDAAGDIYLLAGSAIRKIDGVTGIITLIAGGYNDFSGSPGYGDGGPAGSALFYIPRGLAVDSASNIYIGDYYSLRKISAATGIIQTIAGNGHSAYSSGALAANVGFGTGIESIAVDASGNIFFYLLNQGTVYRIDAVTTEMTQVVGNGTPASPATGIGGLASNARLGANNSVGLAFDSAGNLYIADQENAAVYQVSLTSGDITLYAGASSSAQGAGTGCATDTGDGGAATAAYINGPIALAFDAADNLYIAEDSLSSSNCPVRRVDAATGLVHTVAGTPATIDNRYYPVASDNTAFDLQLEQMSSVVVDRFGNLYVASNAPVYDITTNPSSIVFADQFAGTVNDESALMTVSNIGVSTTLDFSNQPFFTSGYPFLVGTVSGTNPQDCSVGSLTPGESCGIEVLFDPIVNGNVSGSVVVEDNSLNVTGASQTIDLYGGVTNFSGRISLAPSPLAFGSQTVNAAVTLSITLTDTTTVQSVTGLSAYGYNTGTNSTSFSVPATSAVVCTPVGTGGNSCVIPVTFTPQTTGSIEGLIEVAFTDTAGSHVAQVIATGTGATAALTSQAIAFTQPTTPDTYSPGLTIGLVATGGASGNPVVFTIDGSSTGSGSISGSTLTVTGVGTLVIDANQAGNSNYSAATQVQRTVAVTQASQTINFTQPTSPVTYSSGLTIPLIATGGASGSSIVFSIDGSSTATGSISGSTLTVTGTGSLVIDANQAGSANYSAATQVQRTIVVNAQASQTITFTPPASPVTYAPGLTIGLVATGGGSGNPVVFTMDASSTATGSITGSTLTVTGVGTLVIDANQAGNSNYSAATQVQRTVAVTQASQTINFTQPTSPVNYTSGLTITLAATGGASGNPVLFTLDASSTATGTISGNTLTVTSAGRFVIDANQAGNVDYAAAPQVQQTVTVNLIPSDFTVSGSPGSQTVIPGAAATFTITVQASSGTFGNAVTLSSTGLPQGATATFSPTSVTPGSGSQTSTLTVQTPALSANRIPGEGVNWPMATPTLALLLLLPLSRWRKVWAGKLLLLLAFVASLGAAVALSGCNGGFGINQLTTYSLTVTGTSGADTHSTTVQLTVQ